MHQRVASSNLRLLKSAGGSISPEQRTRLAASNAIDAHKGIKRAATRLSEELDEQTSPHGIVVTELSDEDSLVTSVAAVQAAAAAGASR